MGSGTVRKAGESCSPKTWPPATWCYPAAAWWRRCSLSSPMDKRTRLTTSPLPLTWQLKRALERDDVWPNIHLYHCLVLSPLQMLRSYLTTFCISLPLACVQSATVCTRCSETASTLRGGMHAPCLIVKLICISRYTRMYSRELYYCPTNFKASASCYTLYDQLLLLRRCRLFRNISVTVSIRPFSFPNLHFLLRCMIFWTFM